jgi:hypothetical protein
MGELFEVNVCPVCGAILDFYDTCLNCLNTQDMAEEYFDHVEDVNYFLGVV